MTPTRKYQPRVDGEVLRFIGLFREEILKLPGHPGGNPIDLMTHMDFVHALTIAGQRYLDKDMP